MRGPLLALLLLPCAARAAECPPEMALIDGQYCIDKWEATIVDTNTGEAASPYFTPNKTKGYPGARWQKSTWVNKPSPKGENKYPMPDLPARHAAEDFEPKAVSVKDVYPQGFMSKPLAAKACSNALKRLCTRAEWYKACAGPASNPPKGTYPKTFPYGPEYEKGKCNFNLGAVHPLVELGRSSSELDDPRLMLAAPGGARMLKKTGEMTACVDPGANGYGVFDMVGNQDELIDDPEGGNEVFVGSFYARDQKDDPQGCASMINGHVEGYFDYSLGFRCCQTAAER